MAADLKVAEKARTLVLCFDGTSNEYDADVRDSFRCSVYGLRSSCNLEHQRRKILRSLKKGLLR